MHHQRLKIQTIQEVETEDVQTTRRKADKSLCPSRFMHKEVQILPTAIKPEYSKPEHN